MDALREVLAKPKGPSSKHAWLKERLSEYIDAYLVAGDLVPSERLLAELAGVSRMTARKAIDELAAEGRIFREVGRGSFVSAPSIDVPLHLSSFTEEMVARGMKVSGRQLSSEIIGADPAMAAALQVDVGAKLWALRRVREADGQPIAVENMYMVASIAPGLHKKNMGDESLYRVLSDEYSIVPDAAVETVRARNASEAEADLLGLKEGAAVLHRTRTATWRGTVIEYTVSSYRGDRYMLIGEVTLPTHHTQPGSDSVAAGLNWVGVPV